MTRVTPAKRAEPKGLVISGKKYQLRLGWKTLIAAVIAVIIVWIGISTADDAATGFLYGLASVLGAILGVFVQIEAVPKDFAAEASAAVRGLLEVSDQLESAARLATQLAGEADGQRLGIALVQLQDDILGTQNKVGLSMAEWDLVAPGATDEVVRLRQAGAEAFAKFDRKGTK